MIYKKKFRSQNKTLLRINKFSELEINEEYQSKLYNKFCELLDKTDLTRQEFYDFVRDLKL